MKAEERKHLEENTLAHGVQTLVQRAKSGRLVGLRWLGLALAAVLVIGVWWYAVHKSRQADSQVWSGLAELVRTGGPSSLDDFAAQPSHKDTTAARIARLEAARILLGPDGIALLQTGDKTQRNKGVENLEKARDEFAKLAESFKDDPTLKATCLMSAGEAELALVGVPKADGLGSLGSVAAAAEQYRKAAQVVGEATPVGEQAKKRADELEAKKDEIERVGVQLYDRLLADSRTPAGPTPDGPKAPQGPLPGTPTETPKPDAPKAPDKPLTAPPAAAGVIGGVGTPPAPEPKKPVPEPKKK